MNLKLRILSFIILSGIVMITRKFRDITKPLPVPSTINITKYWGAPADENQYVPDNIIHLLKINYFDLKTDGLLDELQKPLLLHPPLERRDAGDDASDYGSMEYGMNTNILREYIDYWRDEYIPMWMNRIHYLNLLPQYTTDVQGLNIHYIHTKLNADVKDRREIPLLLLHGWPGSVRELYEIIMLLSTPEPTNKDRPVFEVIAPSLPGYGWSDGAESPGFGNVEIAVVLRNLMIKLGHTRFYVQGGDWGSIIGSNIATLFPENVIGYHSNLCLMTTPLSFMKAAVASIYPSYFIDEQHIDFVFPIRDKLKFLLRESGYFHLQATKPDTIGIVLQSNPIGLAAYILEKFLSYNHNISREAILDNIMIYYMTNSITTSVRLYAESYTVNQLSYGMGRVPTAVPTGCVRFKNDFGHALDWQLRDKYTNLVHSTFSMAGGHFAALEVPQILYNDFLTFVKTVDAL